MSLAEKILEGEGEILNKQNLYSNQKLGIFRLRINFKPVSIM